MARVTTKLPENKNPWSDDPPYFPKKMGYRPDVSDRQYFSSHSYVSSHKVMSWHKAQGNGGVEEKFYGSPSAFEMGTMLHALVLNTKEEAAEIIRERCTHLTAAEIKKVNMMYQAIRSHDQAMEMLTPCDKEMAMYYTGFGMKLRGKADAIDRQKKVIIDVKTAGDIRNFKSSIREFGYSIQTAFYLQLANLIEETDEYTKFYWIVVDKYKGAVSVVECPQEEVARGNKIIRAYFEETVEGSNWPGYPRRRGGRKKKG